MHHVSVKKRERKPARSVPDVQRRRAGAGGLAADGRTDGRTDGGRGRTEGGREGGREGVVVVVVVVVCTEKFFLETNYGSTFLLLLKYWPLGRLDGSWKYLVLVPGY